MSNDKKSNKTIINTDKAPEAVGPYSQAVKVNLTSAPTSTVYLSGQIPLNPKLNGSKDLPKGALAQARQVFKNLEQVALASSGSLKDIVKLNVYLTDMDDYPHLNQVMLEFFKEPFPARAAVCVKELPLGAIIEVDAIMVI